MKPALDLVLEDTDKGAEVWRGQMPPHTVERFIAATHLAGVVAGVLPNDGAPVRLDRFDIEADEDGGRLAVEVGAGGSIFKKSFPPARAVRDDAEVIVARLLATKELAAGTYRYRCRPAAAPAATGGALRVAPLPRRLPPLARRSLWDCGLTALPGCRHATIVLPRGCAGVLVAQARARADVEVGALLIVEPFLATDGPPCRLGVLVADAVPLAHGTTGTETKLRITPEALAAVPVDETKGRGRSLAHSHPFGDKATPHFLSIDDKAVATAWFWQPFSIQLVIDPRFTAPEHALAAYSWNDGALERVCLQLVDHNPTKEKR